VLTGTLGLRDAVASFRQGYGWGDKTRVQEVAFEDWTLDGELLRDLIRRSFPEDMAAPDGEVTLLSDRWVASAPVRALERLLAGQPGDFDDGRIALYVCKVDGDLGCATLSADVVVGTETVEWRDLGWQVDYEPGVKGAHPPLSIRFDRTAYEAVLREALARWRLRAAAETAPPKRRWFGR
jgi:hypothetical protein